MYGSHDSMTCYKPKNFIHKIFQVFSKTQRLPIPDQILEGCTVFDIRIRLNKDNNLIACHGLCEYKVDVMSIINLLEKNGCYYRIVLENTFRKTTDKDLDYIKAFFLTKDHPYCIYVSDKKYWNTSRNIYGKIHPKYFKELNCHKESKIPFIPKWHLRKYKKYNSSDSLNENTEVIFWYDYIDLK
jgi:hypothetical protein